ncbi:MAG TPA: tetratricopeptide repeat protein [Planctomycetaceae bacterium]
MRWSDRWVDRDEEPAFVEARPGLWDRLLEVWHAGGVGRWLGLAGIAVTLPFRLLRAVLDAVVAAFRFAASETAEGLQSRRLRHFVQGVPAFFAAVGVAVVGGVVIGRTPELAATYRIAAATAYHAKDWEEAKLCYERLFRLDGGSAETRLYLGLTLEKMGLDGEAEALIGGVAEGDAGGDPRANRWVASRLLADPETPKDPERLRSVYTHLVRAERGLPQDTSIKLDLARYHLATGDAHRAIPKLAAAAAGDPALHFDLARLYLQVGQPELARQTMKVAERHFRKQSEADPHDRRARLLLANCVANLGRLDESVVILQDGIKHDPEGPYAQAIAKVHLSVYDQLATRQPPDYRAMIGALREALRYDPRSVDAAVRLAGFGGTGAPGSGDVDPEANRQAREMLEGLLAAGEQPPAVHMALGLKAWQGGDLEKARWHFERAYELDPALSGVANNLAWVLSHQAEPELDRALAIIEPVIERFPDEPHFLDTRGEIYLRQGRWEEALRDLERALPRLKGNARIHESLATVYERLGRPEIAERHRREAARNGGTGPAATPNGDTTARAEDAAGSGRP